MKKISLALGMFVAMVMAVGLPGTVMAASNPRLLAPTGLACDFNATPYSIIWDNVDGAAKYAVEVTASYNTLGGVVELTSHFTVWSYELDLSFSALSNDFLDGAGSIDPFDVDVQVKGLNPPPGKSQNNPFSAAECTLPTA